MNDKNRNPDPSSEDTFDDLDQPPTAQAPASEQGDGSLAEDTVRDVAELSGPAEWHRQADDHRDRHLPLAADYENCRKRAGRERQEAGWRAQADMVRGLIAAIDDLSRFAHVDPVTTGAKTVVDGVDMVERKMMKSLAGHGLEIVDP